MILGWYYNNIRAEIRTVLELARDNIRAHMFNDNIYL